MPSLENEPVLCPRDRQSMLWLVRNMLRRHGNVLIAVTTCLYLGGTRPARALMVTHDHAELMAAAGQSMPLLLVLVNGPAKILS